MQTPLATETLKTGETMQIECVLAPDEARAEQIKPFLGHKPSGYFGHIQAALADRCDTLETRFYIGLVNGEMVGNIMTVESEGVGILGHVNTREDQRRKGICQHIMRHQMEDFRQRGGHVLLLGTGYQSPPYWIYHSFGFQDWKTDNPGSMRYTAAGDEDFEARFFAPAPSRPVKAHWKHWPLVTLLASVPGAAYLRSLTLGLWGTGLLEGPYTKFLVDSEYDPQTKAAVLESETGAVVGMATLIADRRWQGGISLLDAFAHPNVKYPDWAALLEALPLPDAKTQCYADPRDGEKITALEAVGFRRDAVLPEQFREGEVWREAWLYSRNGTA